jgi:hypothetical protein
LLRSEIGVATYDNLLYYFPFRYVDRSQLNEISDLPFLESSAQIEGRIVQVLDAGAGRGKKLIAVIQMVITSNAGGIMQQDFFFLLSRFDNEMRRDKTKTGMKELLRKGHWLWTPPRGYKNENRYHRAVDWNIVVTEEGELLRHAFQWRAKNTYSSAEIVRRLNHLGMKIDERRMLEIFRNPFYCGILITRMLPGEIIVGQHEPIVSQEDFLKINSPDNEVANKTYETMSLDLPLRKSMRCPTCNHLMTGFYVKSKDLFYYKCQKKCAGVNYSAKKLHVGFEYSALR